MPRIVRRIPNKKLRRVYVLTKKAIGFATNWMRTLPNFIIIGAAKCGTTTLFHDLRSHPTIETSFVKEILFFSDNYWKGLSWYRMHFPTFLSTLKNPHIKICEASPYYMFHPGTPKRVYRHLPDVKIIVMLRNPVDRAYSQYGDSVRGGYEVLSFEDAIKQENERVKLEYEEQMLMDDPKYFNLNHRIFSYLSRSEYATQIKRWFRYFDREQIMFIKSEDFFRDKYPILQDITQFLGNPPFSKDNVSNDNRNPGKYRAPLNRETREMLKEYFKPHNQLLYQLLGRDFGWESEA